MPERDAKLFEVLIGQVAKDGDVDVVFSKTLHVLGHAELFEPVRNLLHRGPSRGPTAPAGPGQREFSRQTAICPSRQWIAIIIAVVAPWPR